LNDRITGQGFLKINRLLVPGRKDGESRETATRRFPLLHGFNRRDRKEKKQRSEREEIEKPRKYGEQTSILTGGLLSVELNSGGVTFANWNSPSFSAYFSLRALR
jgi:hypothetical protein